MLRRIAIAFLLALSATVWSAAAPASYSVSGRVVDAAGDIPLPGAAVSLDGGLWAVTDAQGRFSIKGVQPGTYTLTASCLGYVDTPSEVEVKADVTGLVIRMQEHSLALKEVVVTAQNPKEGVGTSHTLGRDALNHLQLSSMTDMAALLPGGKTSNPDLTSGSAFALRSGGSGAANAAFGTALEVDGVRLGNNAGFGAMAGVDTRSISVDNVESVEVITGVPSAEYGDLNSGMVRIHTRKGRTPLNVSFTVNPRTWQTSLSKGLDLQKGRGVLNIGAEWARATKKLVSPYESYTRRGITLTYSNTFADAFRFEAGASGNLGGMNSEDDPDAFSGEFTKVRDNAFRANSSLTWLLNRPWATNLALDASVNYADNLSHARRFNTFGSNQPAVHAVSEGYWLADRLPLTYYSDQITDSKELDFAASFKYTLNRRWDEWKSNLKAGLQWKANGNVGAGEYYEDPALAANGYRPRPYTDYPFMHNVSLYAEEDLTIPLGGTRLQLVAGLRFENVYVAGSRYDDMQTLSPRVNAKWKLSEHFSVRGGWGVTEKLPSFYILYPRQEYRDIQTFGFSHGASSSYVYYTQPYTTVFNPSLKWQRGRNAEVGIDAEFLRTKVSLVGFYNRTSFPYKYSNLYEPFSYNIMQRPGGFVASEDPMIRVDSQTGAVYVQERDGEWVPMDLKVTDSSFARSTWQDNGADMDRAGVELTVDFPQIEPIFTQFRLDASYVWTYTVDESLSYYYANGWSHPSLPDRSYPYVGIYANGGNGTSVANGRETSNLDANLTVITHIPQARLIVTCRLEASLLTRSRNLSVRNGADYAFTVSNDGKAPTGGNIHDGDSYTAILPVAYMDLDGTVRDFTAAEASDPAFSNLILKSGNTRTFAQDGYGAYMSANLSITKEIGDHASLSFFANNFTNSRPYVVSKATGVGAIFTPAFYYGLTCRLKF
ncbi:MAG: TonB-dependent receptor [Bacteroidales bacterium]|nr:TonB-dependent receptor [Bacteroidales bacterium]